jgi:hypothetical protein
LKLKGMDLAAYRPQAHPPVDLFWPFGGAKSLGELFCSEASERSAWAFRGSPLYVITLLQGVALMEGFALVGGPCPDLSEEKYKLYKEGAWGSRTIS